MEDLPRILRTGLLPKIGMEPGTFGGFQSWVGTSDFVPTRPVEETNLHLGRTKADPFVRAVNYDFERFALSAKESYLVALAEWDKHAEISWPVLKLYYASFFAAHAIMRSRGAGISKLDKKRIATVNELLSLYEPRSTKAAPGMYLFRRFKGPDDAPNEFSVMLQNEPAGKGVHEGFWLEFCRFLESDAEEAIRTGEPDAADFLAASIELKDAILLGGSGSAWLSTMRNEVNYQHLHEVWLPYRRTGEAYRFLHRDGLPKPSVTQLNISKSKFPVTAFVHIATRITGIALEIGDFVASRSTKGRAFGQKWRRLSNQMRS